MFERVQCPSCSAPYGLKPHRVRREHRRAMCFKCGGIFPIGDAVTRLLGEAPAPVAPASAPFWGGEPAAPAAASQAAAAIAAPWDLDMAQPPAESEAATLGIPASDVNALQKAAEEILSDPVPATLSLDDLEGADEEIMEKTLHGVAMPPPMDAPEPLHPPMSAGEGGYSSAADAISRLLGGVVTPESNKPRPLSTSMDLEATLNALESSLKGPMDFDGPTLGGLKPPPTALSVPSHLSEPEFAPELGTVQLSRPELLAAMRSATTPEPVMPEPMERTLMLPAMAPPPKASLMPPSMEMEATMMMMPPAGANLAAPPSDNMAMPPIMASSPAATVQYPSPTLQIPTPGAPAASFSSENDPNLLKVQVGSDVMGNLSMDQVVRMVQSGEIQEFHMVARQFSENWLEASKVPALRPVFERLRRSKPAEPMPPPPSLGETAPVKKSLFGGLFGKKD
ncbi:MAG: hypothetical protein IPL96_10195 [Holophagaceae bacterium]|nr:hypothetical protein [Holophagaceae bacterium]